ncbi:MAG: hypothetical protein K2K57_12090 [Oscillospiraceae bacterium]|nr:hypothetical protein [Oscillospiraceae bacterium]
MNEKKLPTLREIFFEFELDIQKTPEHDVICKAMSELLKTIVSKSGEPDFVVSDKVFALLLKASSEAQAQGFEQGFEFAKSLYK